MLSPFYESIAGDAREEAARLVAEGRRFGFAFIDHDQRQVDALKYGAPPHGGIAWGFDRLIMLMSGLQPRFSAERARTLLKRTSVGPRDTVKSLSKGMVVQLHLALIAAAEYRL